MTSTVIGTLHEYIDKNEMILSKHTQTHARITQIPLENHGEIAHNTISSHLTK